MSAELLIDRLAARGQTVACAESLTGGLVAASFVDVEGASEVFCGGVVAYATRAKLDVLGVKRALIDSVGTVHSSIAESMALAAVDLFGADYGIGTTGVAGPGPHEGHEAGTVHVAVAGPGGVVSRHLHLSGSRRDIRIGATDAALSLLAGTLEGTTRTGGAP